MAGWMLHAKNNGTKSRRRQDKASNLRPDHIWREENLHSQRPTQSPRLKSRKWTALKMRGWEMGVVYGGRMERTAVVMAGKTACELIT